MKLFFYLLAGLATLSILPAQTDDSDGSNPPPQAAPSPPRNIMPQTMNHKPNPTQPPAELAAAIQKFFSGLKAGDYANTYETFLAGTRLGLKKDKMSFFVSKTQEAFGLYGGLTDYEIFDNYSIGSNVLVLTYLSRHSIQPLRWRFIYYRPAKKWGLINMGFDDVLLDMLD
jgi:hypothetical protein